MGKFGGAPRSATTPFSKNPASTISFTRGVKKHLSALQRFDGRDQVPGGVRFQHKSPRAGVQSFPNHLIAIGDGEHDDSKVGVVLRQLAGGGKAIEVGHVDVEDGKIRLE